MCLNLDADHDKSSFRRILERVTFIPAPTTEGEFKKWGMAWGTWTLIAVNTFIYYIPQQMWLDFTYENLLFLPYNPTILNFVISPFTAMFIHGNPSHLWGNMFFLWAMGSVVERRIGLRNYLLCYLFAGLIGGLGYVNVITWMTDRYPHYYGASGAIAGVMGLYAVRCYFKTVQVPFPLLGLFSMLYPLYLKIRMNAFVLIGMFFVADLSQGIGVLSGARNSGVANWVHLMGMLGGIGLGFMLKLNDAAIEERHLDIGLRPLKAGFSLIEKEEHLQQVLEINSENLEAQLELARIEAGKHVPSSIGRDIYQKVIRTMLLDTPVRAADIFREYLNCYWQRSDDAMVHYQLAQIYARQEDYVMAARCLNMLVEDDTVDSLLREKSMFHEGLMLEKMGQKRTARLYFERMAGMFPQGAFREKVAKKLVTDFETNS